MIIDWKALSSAMRCENQGSSQLAQQALSNNIGDKAVQEAVECYLSGGQGAELARSVLWHIQPRSGMDYCYAVYKGDSCIERRRSAVELLRVVADSYALGWVSEFLNDSDPEIQSWGAGLIDQLLFSSLIDVDDCGEVLSLMQGHTNQHVRERFEAIREHLSD